MPEGSWLAEPERWHVQQHIQHNGDVLVRRRLRSARQHHRSHYQMSRWRHVERRPTTLRAYVSGLSLSLHQFCLLQLAELEHSISSDHVVPAQDNWG